ncbi:hypothetical protein NCPPB3923_24085 [Burkholderia glumae]|nr:hypothetical protein NCPPB3923_24085 [Burkholderia glumae]
MHARGTRVLLDVMSIDELTIEASVRLLNVLDAPSASDTEAADEEGEGDETLLDAPDDSAESEAEALAESGAAEGEAGALAESGAAEGEAGAPAAGTDAGAAGSGEGDTK